MAAKQRDEREQQRDIAVAWMTATLSRAKRIPKLHELLQTRTTRQSPTEMLANVRLLSQITGMPMRTVAHG